jgi:glutathione S-transferase
MPTIKLYQFRSPRSIPNASPFCMKVETFLRMAKLDYEVVTVMDPRKAPKGKLPYIIDNGKKIADSGIILNYLTKQYRVKIDQDLSEKDQAIGVALTRMMEEHFYWTLVYSRFLDSKYAHVSHKVFFGKYPWPIRTALTVMITRKVRNTLYEHGLGRHSEKEI